MRAHALRSADWPQDGRIWEAQWFGCVSTRNETPSSISIEVVVAPEEGSPLRVIQVGVGELPMVSIGSRRLNGQFKPARLAPDQFDDIVSLHGVDTRILRSGDQVPSSSGDARRYYIPPKHKKLGLSVALQTYCCAIPVADDPFGLIVPCVEVFRSWYGRSTALANRLLAGPFETQLPNALANPDGTVERDSQWHVRMRTGLSANDAFVVAALALDPVARECAKVPFDEIAQSAVRSDIAHLRAVPPLCGLHRLRARGTWIKSENRRRFLVHQLLRVPYPGKYKTIFWNLDNDGRSDGTIDRGRPLAFSGGAEISALAMREEFLKSGGIPNRQFDERQEDGIRAVLMNAPILRRSERLPVTHQADPKGYGSDKSPSGEHSTTEGSDSRSEISPASAEDLYARPPAPSKFEKLREFVKNLEATLGYRSQEHIVSGGSPDRSSHLEFSEFRPPARRTRHWTIVDGRPRRLLVIEISDRDRSVFALEIEVNKPSKEGAMARTYNLALLGPMACNLGTDHLLRSLIDKCAENFGVWPKAIDAHAVARIRHGKGFESRLTKHVQKLLSAPASENSADEVPQQQAGRT